jgi:hypothetical protein
VTYDEFIERGRVATADDGFQRELRQLYAPGGTLTVLVRMILELRSDLGEALVGRQMMSDADIRAAIGTQGQILGMDIILHGIHEAMTQEITDVEVSAAGANGASAVP